MREWEGMYGIDWSRGTYSDHRYWICGKTENHEWMNKLVNKSTATSNQRKIKPTKLYVNYGSKKPYIKIQFLLSLQAFGPRPVVSLSDYINHITLLTETNQPATTYIVDK